MSKYLPNDLSVSAAEKLIHEHFCRIPFHNLNLLYPIAELSTLSGGTCSDKSISFFEDASRAGFEAALHTGYIGGKEIHRLVRLSIGGRLFFADVGNGWPALQLFPADKEVEYGCFGMQYRTEIRGPWIFVFHKRQGKESLQLEINLELRPQDDIRKEIEARFISGIEYPFSQSIRFSMIVDDRFLFLRGNRLEIFSDSGFHVVEGIEPRAIPLIVQKYFRFDVSNYFHN
jgi:arylamine N-acetyltransferase